MTLGLVALAAPAGAQGADDAVRFKITSGGRDLYKLAIPLPLGEKASARTAADVLENDLALSGYFRVLDPSSFLANLAAEELSINPTDWRNVAAEGVIKARATALGTRVRFEFRLYEVSKGDQPVLSKDYSGPMADARRLAHQFANDVVRYYTGEDGFFLSRITFSGNTGPKRRDIFTMDWDGAGREALTRRSQNLLPTWSPTGGGIAFTSFMHDKPDLYFLATTSGAQPQLLSARPGINMGAAFSPDGSKIAATLSFEGNSEIYLLSATSGQILKRLTNTPFIDTSPTWSPDGSRIAFVSDRHGSPQIWVMAADGSSPERLTRRGNYNQTPAWCPRADLPLIAFTARDERMSYDIFTVNVSTGEYLRVTEGRGSNQHPTWAPNGRALAYESSRGGVWISTADGRTERQIFAGHATAPQWGPSLVKR